MVWIGVEGRVGGNGSGNVEVTLSTRTASIGSSVRSMVSTLGLGGPKWLAGVGLGCEGPACSGSSESRVGATHGSDMYATLVNKPTIGIDAMSFEAMTYWT